MESQGIEPAPLGGWQQARSLSPAQSGGLDADLTRPTADAVGFMLPRAQRAPGRIPSSNFLVGHYRISFDL
jgi:hypothetical protein